MRIQQLKVKCIKIWADKHFKARKVNLIVRNNALVTYCNTSDHNFNWINARLISKEKNSLRRKCFESELNSQFSTIDLKPGPYFVSRIITIAIITQWSIQANREENRSLLRIDWFKIQLIPTALIYIKTLPDVHSSDLIR